MGVDGWGLGSLGMTLQRDVSRAVSHESVGEELKGRSNAASARMQTQFVNAWIPLLAAMATIRLPACKQHPSRRPQVVAVCCPPAPSSLLGPLP